MQIFSINADFGGAIHNNRSFLPFAFTTWNVSRLVSLIPLTFHNDLPSLVRIYPKMNLDYSKYPTYNFPPLQYSVWFTLDSCGFRANRGPPLGRLETVSSYPLSSSNPGRLETAGPVIAFFFSDSPMRTGYQPIRVLFTLCDWQCSGTVPANQNLAYRGFICKHSA